MVFLKPLAAGLLLLCLSGCSATTAFFFYPQSIWIGTPDDAGLRYQDVWLQAADGTRLHSWWIPAQGETADTGLMVLYLHGNAENISSHSRSIYWLATAGVSVLALDFRGFGASEGQALLPGVLQDIEAAAIWLRAQHPDQQLVVLGQSIGSALAVNFVAAAGARYQVEALVLDAPFTGFGSVARDAMSSNLLGWLIWPFTVLVPGAWDPASQQLPPAIPVLMLHSPDDSIVRYRQGRRLYQRWQQTPRTAPLCWHDSQGPHVASFAYPHLRELTLAFMHHKRC